MVSVGDGLESVFAFASLSNLGTTTGSCGGLGYTWILAFGYTSCRDKMAKREEALVVTKRSMGVPVQKRERVTTRRSLPNFCCGPVGLPNLPSSTLGPLVDLFRALHTSVGLFL